MSMKLKTVIHWRICISCICMSIIRICMQFWVSELYFCLYSKRWKKKTSLTFLCRLRICLQLLDRSRFVCRQIDSNRLFMHSDKHVTLLCPSGFIIIKQTVQISSFPLSAALHYVNYTHRTSWPTTINISTIIENLLFAQKDGFKASKWQLSDEMCPIVSQRLTLNSV